MNDLELWVATTLANDESSTDEEMTQHFVSEGPMTHERALFYIAQRNDALRSPVHFKLQLANEGESVNQ